MKLLVQVTSVYDDDEYIPSKVFEGKTEGELYQKAEDYAEPYGGVYRTEWISRH